jgi:hypothetical protein
MAGLFEYTGQPQWYKGQLVDPGSITMDQYLRDHAGYTIVSDQTIMVLALGLLGLGLLWGWLANEVRHRRARK